MKTISLWQPPGRLVLGGIGLDLLREERSQGKKFVKIRDFWHEGIQECLVNKHKLTKEVEPVEILV